MKNLRGEFLFGYFTLNILHWTFYIGHFTLDILHWIFYIRWVFKGFTFAKGETFFKYFAKT